MKINEYLMYLKQMILSIQPRLVIACLIISWLLTSCIDISPVIYNGTEADMFLETSVKKVNIPIWVEVIGIFFFIVCIGASGYTSKLVMELTDYEYVDIPIKKLIILNAVIVLAVFSLTSLLGFFAIGMEILDVDFAFKILLILQLAFILLACLSSLEKLGIDLEKLGFKNIKWFSAIGLLSKKVTKKIDNSTNGDKQ